MDQLTKESIWTRLSAIDISDQLTEKEVLEDGTSLSILPWMNAHALMMESFPEYTWEFTEDPEGREVHYFNDGTAEVRCRMTIGPHTQITSLFVRDFSGPIRNPNSGQINTTKQRCRVKAMAEFGLGHQLWIKSKAQEEVAAEAVQEELLPDEQIVVEEATRDRVERLWREDTWEKIQQSRNKSAAQKIFDRFNRKLTQLGLEDYNQNRWAEICDKKGWKV
jgi:hypothetical protein